MLGDTGQIVEEGRSMWVLLIILLTAVPGIGQGTALNTFTTQQACQQERNRIGFEMAESYPYERDFIIVCKFREDRRDNPKMPIRLLRPQGHSVRGEHPAGMLVGG